MNERSRAVSEIEAMFQTGGYPAEFTEAYDQMECLANRTGRETFLVRNKETGVFAIAKCYDKALYSLTPETELLKGLENPGIPKFIGHYENDAMLCLVREYVEGKTLNKYAEEKELSRKEVLSVCLKLADILIFLHGQEKPIIHRDVKPENIIVRPDGSVVLIDFDIARTVKEGSDSDTLFFGTRGYAPPEQYGFEQTDQRADIFSFGVLLRFLLTGKTRQAKNSLLPPDLQHIIDKCTAFSPKDRYDSMSTVKRALQKIRPAGEKRKILSRILTAAALLAMLCAGFAVGRYTGLLKPVHEITFQEPLIEQAVRVQLGFSDTQKITADDLLKVSELYIYGTLVQKSEDDYYHSLPDDYQRGGLRSLSDIEMLPNLESLCIAYQGEVNLSGLSSARFLNRLDLRHLRIPDPSPLQELKELDSITLFDTGISGCRELENCPRLYSMDIGNNLISSVSEIGVHPQLKELSLNCLSMDTLDGIENMPKIERLHLNEAEVGDLSALLKLSELKQIFVDENNLEELTKLFDGTDVEIIVG